MKTKDIHIRDPFILPYNGKYYMFGTPGPYAWEGAGGFLCYISEDLEEWSDPVTAFSAPSDFWATKNFWAPEVHEYNGRFYMFASFYSDEHNRATQILSSDLPEGPYTVWSIPVTPPEWMCLDGTFFVDEDGMPWTVFCHEWLQAGTGTICAVPLKKDLSAPDGDPVVLFSADEAVWADPINDGKLIDGKKCMVTDGPFILRDENRLVMFWSSFSKGNYAVGMALSDSGSILGPWKQISGPLFNKDGGHGMVFNSFDGRMLFSMHKPNMSPFERASFSEIAKNADTFIIRK